MEMDIVDEQVDTVGRAFMGLTLGCARCHDHKFDPISPTDYYALAGIFKSTRSWRPSKVAAGTRTRCSTRKDRARQAARSEAGRRAEAIDRGSDPAGQRAAPEDRMARRFRLAEGSRAASIRQTTRAELKRLREELAELEKSRARACRRRWA